MAKAEAGHSTHMCALTCCACNMDLAKIKTVVKDARYVCKSCGHVAAKAKNLCVPVVLK
jgi:transposase-like protein